MWANCLHWQDKTLWCMSHIEHWCNKMMKNWIVWQCIDLLQCFRTAESASTHCRVALSLNKGQSPCRGKLASWLILLTELTWRWGLTGACRLCRPLTTRYFSKSFVSHADIVYSNTQCTKLCVWWNQDSWCIEGQCPSWRGSRPSFDPPYYCYG